MEPKEAYERRDQVAFLDVREWYEWEAGTVAGAVHIPIRTLTQRVEELPDDREIVVVCQVGQRSALAADYLNGIGRRAHNLEGGVAAWVAQGLPLVTGEGDGGQIVDGWAQAPDLP